MYADDITVWTLYPHISRQEQALQAIVGVTNVWCDNIRLERSKAKQLKWLYETNVGAVCFQTVEFACSSVRKMYRKCQLGVLGLQIAQIGSESTWVQCAKRRAAETIHLYVGLLESQVEHLRI